MDLESVQECLECDCWYYCTIDSCILDINDEKQDFEYFQNKKNARVKL